MSDQVKSHIRQRRRARRIIELMRGDVIRILSESQLNNKIYFIDYIDETRIQLIPDMRSVSDASSKIELEINLDNGRFPSDINIKSIELLYRNQKEQGYARQRGLLPGKWIEIEYITPENSLKAFIYGEIVSLADNTDCIGVAIYNPSDLLDRQQQQVVYIDFEFKGLSPDLNIRSIKVCNKPLSLLREKEKEKEPQNRVENEEDTDTSVNESEGEHDESEDFEASAASKNVNLEFQKSPPGPEDNRPAQNRLLDEGDKIAITFEPMNEPDASSSFIFIQEEFRYYSLEEQQQGLLDALIEHAPTSKSHHLSTN
jgi:hypothetical protein